MQKNEKNQITHLFFMAKTSQKILKKNHEVLTMDCIYKTNRYKMPLLIISGQTALNTNFYVAFCFLHQKKSADYLWALQNLHAIYSQLHLPWPTVIITDMKKGMHAISFR